MRSSPPSRPKRAEKKLVTLDVALACRRGRNAFAFAASASKIQRKGSAWFSIQRPWSGAPAKATVGYQGISESQSPVGDTAAQPAAWKQLRKLATMPCGLLDSMWPKGVGCLQG